MPASPALPLAPAEYSRPYHDQVNRVLTQYFKQLQAVESLETAAESTRATTDAEVTVMLTDGLLLVDTTAASVTVTLPDPAGALYRVFGVKRTSSGANTLTISSAAGTIDGGTLSIAAQYGYYAVKSDGSNYWVVGKV